MTAAQGTHGQRGLGPHAPPRQALRRLALALLSLLLIGGALAAEDFRVTEASTRLVDGTFELDARIDYAFSDEALEALANGVPLTLEVHIQVRPKDSWIWETSLVDQRLRYRLVYKPLSDSYLVARLPGDQGRSYVTREAALAALGELRDLQLLGEGRLDPDRDYEVHIRASLDIEELPLPLRPMAYLSPSWKQASDWSTWPLNP